MLRLGIISEIGEGENLGYARVSFDENDIVSGWLAMPSMSTKSNKQWMPVAVNAQVACLMDDRCEQGAIVLVLWSDADMPPGWAGPDTMGVQFSDGTEIFYNTQAHKLAVNAPTAELNITCSKLNIEGEVNIKGNTSVLGDTGIVGATNIMGTIDVSGLASLIGGAILAGTSSFEPGAASINGAMTITGALTAIGDIASGKVSLTTHTHPSAPDGPPSPPTQ